MTRIDAALSRPCRKPGGTAVSLFTPDLVSARPLVVGGVPDPGEVRACGEAEQ